MLYACYTVCTQSVWYIRNILGLSVQQPESNNIVLCIAYSVCQDVSMRGVHYVVVPDSVGNEQWHCICLEVIPGFFVMLQNTVLHNT
jgi:hypothetical protein